MMSYTEKYAPKSSSDFIGQKTALEQIELFLKKGRPKKALLVYGQTGCGKTTAIKFAAEKLGYHIAEIVPEQIGDESALNNMTKTATLLGTKKLILVDDIEAFYAVNGAVGRLMKLVKESVFPIVFIALDVWDQKLRYLRLSCETVQFRRPTNQQVQELLLKVIAAEKIKVDPGVAETIAKNAAGDIRAALYDLEMLCIEKNEIRKEDTVLLEQRPKEENIFNAVQKIFRTTDIVEASKSFENLDVEPGFLLLWLAENVTKEYNSKREIADAYNYLSRSDVFLGRIHRQQHWEFFRYAMFLGTAGVAVSKDKPTQRFVRYTSPMKLSKLSQTKELRQLSKKIAVRIAGLTHTSITNAARFYIPMVKILFRTKPEFKKNFSEKLSLDKEEVSFLSA